ncbi:MAG: flagellar motor switch protein FliN [Actinomycetia bacterium]|nr:flagellar motor switch protein FliN [Actinomycetes bacterium]MCP4960850.1 flagellar motor switch protein FliN [Actinomycetes bacterium]
MKTASTSGLKLRLMLGSVNDAVEAIAVFTGLALAGDEAREVAPDDVALAEMVFVRTTGPTGEVIVGVSEDLAKSVVVGAGHDADDADASWTFIADMCLESARAFVGSMSAGGALVGPVDTASPLEGISALGDTVQLDGVLLNVTSSDDAAGSVVWFIPEEEEPAEAEEVVQPVEYAELGRGVEATSASPVSFLSDVSLEVTVELGRTSMRLKDVLGLTEGSVVELDRQVGAHVDVLVNGSLVAAGEVVVIDDVLGVRITSVHDVEGGIG